MAYQINICFSHINPNVSVTCYYDDQRYTEGKNVQNGITRYIFIFSGNHIAMAKMAIESKCPKDLVGEFKMLGIYFF